MSILSQVAANDNQDEYTPTLLALTISLRRAVNARVAANASFATREAMMLAIANEACLSELRTELQTAANALTDELLIDGVAYRRHQDGSAEYHSLCGTMRIDRATYRKIGERNGPTCVPLELTAGLIEGATPALAFRVALGYAQGPGRHAEKQIRADLRVPPSRSTMERMAKAIGTAVKTAAPRIEPLLRHEEKLPEGTRALSTGLDRTSVPMEELRPPGAPLPTRRKQRTAPYVRKVPPRVDVAYRMAYVGTVSMVDADGGALITRRYAASGAEGPDGILAQMMADIRRARAQDAGLTVGILQDGAPEMWNLMRGALKEQANVSHWHEGVDRYHLNERLADMLRIIEPEPAQRTQRLGQWNAELDDDDGAIDRIAAWLAERIPGHGGEALEKLDAHWTFLVNNNDRMRYATLRKVGLPCGSGATEGSCKSVVMIRAKGCGQRWHEDGVNAALTLRAIYMSERLEPLWSHFANDYVAEVKAAA
jgi:hypothetical protein